MTVQEVLRFLKEYPPEMEIKFATDKDTEAYWLSDYIDNTNSFVWVDIGVE